MTAVARGPIGLDGPVASGKSTVGRGVAQRLGWTFIDTGLMYRAVGFLGLRAGLSPDDEDALTRIATDTGMDIDDARITVEGEEIGDHVHTPDTAMMASRVAEYSGVRRALVAQQRAMADGTGGRIVMVGRDICTVVLPDAPVKIFLAASAEARARRRQLDEQRQGINSDYTGVLAALLDRDRRDAERADSPLRPADGAHQIVTDSLTIHQVIDRIVHLARQADSP